MTHSQETHSMNFVESAKARIDRMKQAAAELTQELNLPPEAKYDILSAMYDPETAISVVAGDAEEIEETIPSLQADVLLVTVTEVETQAVMETFYEKCKHNTKIHFFGSKTYYELGVVNSTRVFLVQSETGVSGPGSSLQTVHEGIQVLSPSSVIMVGIAFGVDPDRQRIGDVLVSKQLQDYGHQRLGTTSDGKPEVISRGDRVTSSIKLLDRCRSASFAWIKPTTQERKTQRKQPRIHFGTILSGEKLINNIELRNQLLTLEPDAIGGEMEGVGLYSAAQSEKVDWILVKAICDWADGNKVGNEEREIMAQNGDKVIKKTSNKDRDQKMAAKNAAEYIVHVLSKTRLI